MPIPSRSTPPTPQFPVDTRGPFSGFSPNPSGGNTYTFRGKTPNDGTFAVGSGPFPDLPAGVYTGNYFGNDPRRGLTSQNVERYSLPRDERDASSSGNTFAVGTGPQPNLPAGRFLPGQIAGAVRRNTQAQEAAARAAQPPPAPVSPTPIAGPAVPVQTTLPNPVTPVAAPTFVPSTGLPNFGSSNLLAQTSLPGTSGGLLNVPNIVSPLQPLLATPSTLPATGSNTLSVPNIGSNLGSQSAFTQLFPAIPDISLTAAAPTTSTTLAADGGPILASDYLPRYENGGEAEGEARRKAEVLSQLRPYFPRWTEDQLAALNDMPLPQLEEMLKRYSAEDKPFSKFFDDILRDREQQAETWMDMAPPRSLPSPEIPPITPYEIPPEGYYPPERVPYDEALPNYDETPPAWPPPVNPFETPLLQVANGGPILASEYLNAGGPVQYFSKGADVDAYGGYGPPGSEADTGPSATSGSTGASGSAGVDQGSQTGGAYGPPGSTTDTGQTAGVPSDTDDPISGEPTDAVSLAMHTPTAILGGWSPAQVAESIGPVALGSLFGPAGTVAALGFSVQDALEANQNPNAPVSSLSGLAGRGIANLGFTVDVEDQDNNDTAFGSVFDAESP
jgi:hypothetical protein